MIGILHALSMVTCTLLTALGASFGQSKATKAAFAAINRQPTAQPEITRTMLLSLALIETGALLGLLLSLLLFFNQPTDINHAIGQLGIALALSLPGLIIGYASSLPAAAAFGSIARQPFIAKKISNGLLLFQSLIQTPLAFGFIIALYIRAQLPAITTLSQALTLIGAGAAIGFGSIGPALGSGYFTQIATGCTGKNKNAFGKLFGFTFISQAVIETPVIFSSIIALLLATKATTVAEHPLLGVAYIAFGVAAGIGTFGAGISSGRTAAAAAEQITIHPDQYTSLSRSSLMAQGLIDTCAIYAFIVALWLLFTPLV